MSEKSHLISLLSCCSCFYVGFKPDVSIIFSVFIHIWVTFWIVCCFVIVIKLWIFYEKWDYRLKQKQNFKKDEFDFCIIRVHSFKNFEYIWFPFGFISIYGMKNHFFVAVLSSFFILSLFLFWFYFVVK